MSPRSRRQGIECSPDAVRALDHQFGEALDLAVSCRVLSDDTREAGDALTAVFLNRLAAELMNQAALLAPLVGAEPPAAARPQCTAPLSREVSVADLDLRMSHAGLVAESDAMSPDLEATVVGLLYTLAAFYRTERELLLVCSLLDSA